MYVYKEKRRSLCAVVDVYITESKSSLYAQIDIQICIGHYRLYIG